MVQQLLNHKYTGAQSCQTDVDLGTSFHADSFDLVKRTSNAKSLS